jgi:hypothetical protein
MIAREGRTLYMRDAIRDDLSRKIAAVAADLKGHPADTEVHKKVCKVKED